MLKWQEYANDDTAECIVSINMAIVITQNTENGN